MIQFDITLITVLIGTTLVGITSGIMGCFVILQRKSLFGDAIAHATLPGLAAMFLYTGSKAPSFLFFGATLSGFIGAICIHLINKHTTLQKETALGVVLSTTFGLGTLLLSIIQTFPNAHKAGINKFLLGNASTLLWDDLCIIVTVTTIVMITVLLCWKEFKTFIFNQEFAFSLGMNTEYIQATLTTLTVITIIVGLQTVGVVLISSLLIAPAAAAYQWTQRLSHMIILSCFFSSVATISGTFLSSSCEHLPTGPTIIVIATICTFFSILFAPHHGIVSQHIKTQHQIQQINAYHMLSYFMLFNESSTHPYHAHDINALQAVGKKFTNKTIRYLAAKNLIESPKHNFWRLTPQGLTLAKKIKPKAILLDSSGLKIAPHNMQQEIS